MIFFVVISLLVVIWFGEFVFVPQFSLVGYYLLTTVTNTVYRVYSL